jgi:dTMP kinase
MNANRGRLFVFEGVDATGKTTLCNELVEILRGEHKPVRHCHFPGKRKGTLGELVYKIHHGHGSEFGVLTIDPCSLQLLHIAAHVDTIESEIKPALRDGEWVILDRFWWSTYVYGLDNGVQESQLRLMINVEINAWGTLKPDIIFLVDSGIPLRDDETNSLAWQRKRQTYKRLADEDILQKCVRLDTGKEKHAKQRALSIIRETVAAFTVGCK